MRYFSDITKQFYETEEACREAETNKKREIEAKRAEKEAAANARKARAAEIEQARTEFLKARDIYNKLLSDFCKDYGSYHYSIKTPDSITELFDSLFPWG